MPVTAADLLRLLVTRLEGARIRYALGGSIASMAYGEPRATLDIDVVVKLDPVQVDELLRLFPSPEFYASRERVMAVAEEGGSFNVIHPGSGMKIDFFVASDPIEERQIVRRIHKEVLPGLMAHFSPPEELILKKLQYLRDGGSEKHLRDVQAMLEISPETIDRSLLAELVDRFGLSDEWRRVAPP